MLMLWLVIVSGVVLVFGHSLAVIVIIKMRDVNLVLLYGFMPVFGASQWSQTYFLLEFDAK